MAELRWNPLLGDWTMVASNRQNRPQMPKDWCPFCPGPGKKVPEHYEVYEYDNDFPALSKEPPEPDTVGSNFYKTEKAYGKCEVILYSPEHTKTLSELPLDHIRKLVDLWSERYTELSKDEKVKYIFEFENRGEEVGVTMPHPHGQIYAYSKMPLKIKTELNSCKKHYEENDECLICRMNKEEQEFKNRIIIENEDFLAYLPFFTDYPYGMFIVSKNHISKMVDFDDREKNNFADILKKVSGTFDSLFDRRFPYMMCIHQAPVNSPEYGNYDDYYHFHVEFYPPLRSKEKIKYYASSEMGAWAACNPRSVEETAEELKEAYKKYLSKNDK
ncbi:MULTISPECIES: galactose-1-phosphate uridylyltransferase [Clostridium]|uniref:galactose-1-phosphate uridylyltransferase n=1 Tax=Clostridium TaxID=1485 RepID=UPI00069DF631|nr:MULTISPECIES: galactose-1-phosphate uridylyltransferase [Clostridium]KOF56387.1 galactose-1-phosphate uridylyltransferase [Clostridium sp. DMHC 10]MCD2347387.1 galactose-1-phosphate uridylyltransferase [Clostridium guangxiense]